MALLPALPRMGCSHHLFLNCLYFFPFYLSFCFSVLETPLPSSHSFCTSCHIACLIYFHSYLGISFYSSEPLFFGIELLMSLSPSSFFPFPFTSLVFLSYNLLIFRSPILILFIYLLSPQSLLQRLQGFNIHSWQQK